MVGRRGFTLVEVLVALVILEVGLLGVVGTLVMASRTVTLASLHERGVGAVESVLDSLASLTGTGSGVRSVPGGAVSWTVEFDGSTTVVFMDDSGRVRTEVWTYLDVEAR